MTDYDAATQKLLKMVKTLQLPPEFSPAYDMISMVKSFRVAFQNPCLRHCVLSQKYERRRVEQERFSAGFCGIASYTWNQLFRMDDGTEVWCLKMITSGEYNIGNHVWLENVFTGQPLDLTFDQFIDSNGKYVEIPYSKIGHYASSDFAFRRAYKFANYLGIDLERIVFENSLRALGRR